MVVRARFAGGTTPSLDCPFEASCMSGLDGGGTGTPGADSSRLRLLGTVFGAIAMGTSGKRLMSKAGIHVSGYGGSCGSRSSRSEDAGVLA